MLASWGTVHLTALFKILETCPSASRAKQLLEGMQQNKHQNKSVLCPKMLCNILQGRCQDWCGHCMRLSVNKLGGYGGMLPQENFFKLGTEIASEAMFGPKKLLESPICSFCS